MEEVSLIILKPDCMEKNLAGKVLARFADEGFHICACKMISLSGDLLKAHYAHLADKPFFPEIEEFMSSRPVIVVALKGESAITRIRELLGPTNSKEAAAGTIRGDYGTDMMLNIAHASDSPEAAKVEVDRFFTNAEVFA